MSESSNVRVHTGWQRPTAAVLKAFSGFQVANIGDAMERLGFTDGGISGIWSGARAVGSALPVLTVAGDNRAVIEALDHIQPGDLLAINAFGFSGRAIIGDNLAQRFDVLGATGAIVDGYVRDKVIIERLGFPVFARGLTPAGPFKNGPGTIGEAVAIGGVVVNPGDIIAADEDGIIVVPLHRADEVILAVAEIEALEASKDAEVEQMKVHIVR
ncbi:Regulator of RNase E activity RraA [Agreia bicolorata]|uniref:Putative 4-hydroxy-4-methyl-2-oxoglutarate aldolase n=1 Tax=Agreia bicolorata TaxID=110935 RepID=A0A1T4YEN2_9MICO|nr:methyltransferase [Agreia bicolorata]SKB00229.1 Regulator of RNase E activity RraA [Agreia bicolorata]